MANHHALTQRGVAVLRARRGQAVDVAARVGMESTVTMMAAVWPGGRGEMAMVAAGPVMAGHGRGDRAVVGVMSL